MKVLAIICFWIFGLMGCRANWQIPKSEPIGEYPVIVSPQNISVVIGESFEFKLTKTIAGHKICSYISPNLHQGQWQDEISTDTDHIKFIKSEVCAIKILNATNLDSGIWRLISKIDNTMKFESRGFAHVINPIPDSYFGTDLTKVRELVPTDRNLTYCVTTNKGIQVINNTDCEPPANFDFNDRFEVNIGIQGQLSEIKKTMVVVNSMEHISTAKEPGNTTKIICRVENLKSNIEFCRFMRVKDKLGLNMMDGLSDGKYRFYGAGVMNGECGLEILDADDADRDLWKCYIGVVCKCPLIKRTYATHKAIVDGHDHSEKLRILDADHTIEYRLDNQSAIFTCNTNKEIDYCWFMHPSGQMFYPSHKISYPNNNFEYFGDGFELGECGLKLKSVNSSDEGQWKCGVGMIAELTMEATKTFELKLATSTILTTTKTVEKSEENTLALECVSLPRNTPVNLCRFITPTGASFAIDERITRANPIQGKYYFDPNKRISQGYCAIIVKDPSYEEHAGTWTCIGQIKNQIKNNENFYDKINVLIDDGTLIAGFNWISLVIGLSTVLSFVIFGVLGRYVYKKNPERFDPPINFIRNMWSRSTTVSQQRLTLRREPRDIPDATPADLNSMDNNNEESSNIPSTSNEFREPPRRRNGDTVVTILASSSSTI